MANQLYPVFDIPTLYEEDGEEQLVMKPGPLFDFDTGDFVLDGAKRVVMVDGRDEYILWCLKMLKTQLGACEAYLDYGVDTDEALMEPDRKAVQSALERTITEALMMHPSTERIYGFYFEWEAQEVAVSFVVKPKQFDAIDMSMNIVT